MKTNRETEQKIVEHIQTESYNILKKFHDICEENNLTYILDYGTLLGAVRHGGFIPWDDDIDVSMPRTDYNKFISIMEEKMNEGTTDLFLQNHYTDSQYYLPFSKLRIQDDSLRELAMSHFDIVHGPWIDIFVFDDMPFQESVLYKNTSKFNRRRRFVDYITPVLERNDAPGQHVIKTLGKKIVIWLLENDNKVVYRYLDWKFSLMENTVREAIDQVNPESPKMIHYAFPINSNEDLDRNTVYRESFSRRKQVQFEEDYFYIPENYDLLLKDRYGDYNVLPPLKDRKSHHEWDLNK